MNLRIITDNKTEIVKAFVNETFNTSSKTCYNVSIPIRIHM